MKQSVLDKIKEYVKPEYQEELIKAIEKAKDYYNTLDEDKQLAIQEIMDGVSGMKVKGKLCLTSIEYLFAKTKYNYDVEEIYVEDIDDDDYMEVEDEISYYIMMN